MTQAATENSKTAKASKTPIEVKASENALIAYDPKADEGWQILDTGEGRLYWSMDPEAAKTDNRANTIHGLAVDVSSFDQEDPETGEMRTRHFVKMQTLAPCRVVGNLKNERGEALPEIAPKGSLVWVGVTHALQDLHAKVKASSFMLEVMLRGVERIVIPGSGGRKVWRVSQAVRATKKRTMIVQAKTMADDDAEAPPF